MARPHVGRHHAGHPDAGRRPRRLRTHAPALVLWLLALATGLVAFDDYGISWDEDQQRRTGRINAWYMLQQSDALLTWRDRDYGPLFELALVPFELMEDEDDIILARHLASHVFFLLAAAAFYVLVLRHTRSRWIALLAMAMLILTPRFYAHSFFNSKDLPAAGLWVLALLALRLAWERPGPWRMALLGAAVAALVNVRVVGLVFVGLAALPLALAWRRRDLPGPRLAGGAAAFAGVFAVLLVATWPFLWPNPPARLLEVVRNMSSFRWQGEVRFLGGYVWSESLPWHFVPTWIAVSTPLSYLALMAAGGLDFGRRLLRSPGTVLRPEPAGFEALVLLSAALPLLAAVLLGPVLYHDWRHFYFVYPGLLFFAAVGAAAIFRAPPLRSPRVRGAAAAVLALLVVRVGAWMAIAHPHQQVYLNALRYTADGPAWEWMELDYWAVSYRQALEWILEHDPREEIRVTGSYRPRQLVPKQNRLLPEGERHRIVAANRGEPADYLVTNWRAIPSAERFRPPGPLVAEITAGGIPVTAIYRVTDPDSLTRPDALVAPGPPPHAPDPHGSSLPLPARSPG